MSFWPQFRRPLLTAGTIYWLLSQHTRLKWGLLGHVFDVQGLAITTSWSTYWLSLVVTTILFCAMYYYLVKRSRGTWLYRRPVATLLVGYFILLMIASYAPLSATQQAYLWGFLIILGQLYLVSGLLLARSKCRARHKVYLSTRSLPALLGWQQHPVPQGSRLST